MAKNGKKVRIFSALEVANICGVVNQTAINWIKNNHLKAFTTPGGQYRIYAEDLLDFLNSRGMRVPDELLEITGQKEKKVLIIDDDSELNDMLRNILAKKFEGYEIFQAFDGFEAGRLIAEIKPTVILLDIDLPGINGHELCKRIKTDAQLVSPVIVAISGLDEESEGEKIISEGADAFFPKPIDFEKLSNTLKDLVSVRGA
ncbi:MAG: response regulator [Sediminispirochaetaceae bacterium]